MARKKSKAKKSDKIEMIEEVKSNGRLRTKNQAILTAFILLFPVLLLAMTGLVGDTVMKVALFAYEAILIKNFIDDYYAGRL